MACWFSRSSVASACLTWACRAGFTTVGLCEIEPYCREVLKKHWPGVPIWSDVREVTGDVVKTRCGAVDLVAGGFPCQPHSVAGSRKGREDERHLWPEFARVVREVRPRWVLAENVPGLRTTAADEVLADLEAAGYACWPLVVGADDVGAPHRRKRVWIVARLADIGRGWVRDGGHSADAGAAEGVQEQGLQRERVRLDSGAGDEATRGEDLAHQHGAGQHREGSGGVLDGERSSRGHDADGRGEWPVGEPTGAGLRTGREPEQASPHAPGQTLLRGWPARPGEQQHEWEAPRLGQPQPSLGGATDGSPGRLAGRLRRAQLKALGNGVVPQVVAEVGRAILAAEGVTA